MCLTEPQAGSMLGDITTMAHKQGDHYLIKGTKQFITSGDIQKKITGSSEYGPYISKHFDYERLFVGGDKDYFEKNGDHLNEEGSKAFANIVTKDLEL